MELTELEKDVLLNGLYGSEFNDETVEEIQKNGYSCHNRIIVWRDCVVHMCKLVTEKNIAGVISSLSKKGLVWCEGTKRDATVAISDDGIEELKKLI